MIVNRSILVIWLYFWVITFSFAQNTISHDLDSLYDIEEALLDSAFAADEAGDYLSAIKYTERCLMVSRDTTEIIDDSPMFSEYKFLVEFYAKAGMWEKALSMQKRRTEYWKNKFQESADNEYAYFMMFRRWTQLLSLSGANKKAIREIHKFISDAKVKQMYLNGISSDAADYYYNLRDYHKAQKCYEKVGNKYGMAKTFAALGDYQNAIALLKKLIEEDRKQSYISIDLNIEQLNGPYDTYLCDLANYYNRIEQYDDALLCERMHRMPSRFELAKSYYNIGDAYAGKNQLDSAIYYLLKAKEIYKIQHQNKQYALVLARLLALYAFTGSHNNLEHYISELINSARYDLISSFSDLTYDERSKYIELYSKLLGEQVMMHTYYRPSDKLVSLAYDALLIVKGALLDSEYGIKRVINESQDAYVKDLWERLRVGKYFLSKQLEKDSLSGTVSVDSLQNVIYHLEDSLVIKCKEYDVITKNMKVKWHDIQKQLSKHDIAIEFLRIPINNDSVMYAALTLRKDSKVPKMTPLFEEAKLKQLPDTLYYQCKEMTEMVWAPLMSELDGIKRIYFSPSGAFYSIAIEYSPGMEKYDIYRLSSTRELVRKMHYKSNNRAVLYGGLDYYAKLDSINRSQNLTTIDELLGEHADLDEMKLRGGKNRLPHTKEEVEKIAMEFRKANWKCLLDTLSMGTEESFKSLSGKKVNTLHIATHGFYYTQDMATNFGYKFLQLDNRIASAEDKALTRSGLIMSGANHILEGKELPEYVEDGILTAKEIAEVDLRGLDMVVLSACQTGLGDISLGEGIFGLQRGFKKAGARTILMSLWKVDDKATQLLMTLFYKNWLSGQSKREALLSAQEYLRRAENGKYNEPKYWAAFILLDDMFN